MLAVSGGKGGTGKTTTALGLATALADRRRKPVVIDADIDMPNLHLRAGVDDDGLERLQAGESVATVATESERYPGVFVIGARPGVNLDRALRNVFTDRPVILDGAAGISERAITPLRYASETVLVARDTPAALTDTVKSIRASRAIGVPIAGIVLHQTEAVPSTAKETLTTDPIESVPTVENPVTDDAARLAYDAILEHRENA